MSRCIVLCYSRPQLQNLCLLTIPGFRVTLNIACVTWLQCVSHTLRHYLLPKFQNCSSSTCYLCHVDSICVANTWAPTNPNTVWFTPKPLACEESLVIMDGNLCCISSTNCLNAWWTIGNSPITLTTSIISCLVAYTSNASLCSAAIPSSITLMVVAWISAKELGLSCARSWKLKASEVRSLCCDFASAICRARVVLLLIASFLFEVGEHARFFFVATCFASIVCIYCLRVATSGTPPKSSHRSKLVLTNSPSALASCCNCVNLCATSWSWTLSFCWSATLGSGWTFSYSAASCAYNWSMAWATCTIWYGASLACSSCSAFWTLW